MAEIYDQIGHGYTQQRRTDPRIYSLIHSSLEECASVINVGAGSGSYETTDLPVIAVEPSFRMIAQRTDITNVAQAAAEALPFLDNAADAVTAFLTIHHWKDKKKGLEECARVAKRQVTLLTWDPESAGFWLAQDYFPDIIALDRTIFPAFARMQDVATGVEALQKDIEDGSWHRPHGKLLEQDALDIGYRLVTARFQ